ncbi:hypothetical protein ACWDSJ_35840 [Nocardia sp. NPDC003482]
MIVFGPFDGQMDAIRSGNRPTTVRPMSVVQVGEERRLVIARHARVIEVEPLEKCFVEQPPDRIGAGAVELYGIRDQREGVTKHLSAQGEFCGCVSQSGLNAGTLDRNVAQLGLDFRLRHGVVGKGIDKPVFLLTQLGKLSL